MKSKAFIMVFLCVMLLAVPFGPALAASDTKVVISWNANTESDLAGYKIYYGAVSGTYDEVVDVGNVVTYTIINPGDDVVYFAVTAYDKAGNESGKSDVVSVNPPPANPTGIKAVWQKLTAFIHGLWRRIFV